MITVDSTSSDSMGCGSMSGGGSIFYTPYPGKCVLSSTDQEALPCAVPTLY